MSQRYEADVAIIGAGPAGTAAAAHLGQLGVDRVVLVDRHDFPRHKTCGSAVSPRGIDVLKELGVWEAVSAESYRINALRLVTPGGRESYQSAGDALEAIVCQRRTLDHLLLQRAQAGGTTFLPYFHADRLIESDGRVRGFVARDGREVHARYTMVAGGTHCTVGVSERPRQIIQAIMGWWRGVDFRPHTVEMIFDRMIAPYYGWLFPESDEVVNIGITYEDRAGEARHKARDLFAAFLDKHYGERLRGAEQIGRWKGHPIAYSYRIDKVTSPGRVVIGESALLTHPATAEGIYQGMRSGMLGAEAVKAALGGEAESKAFARYEQRIKRAFLVSFWGGALFRKVVQTPALDWLVAASEQPLVASVTAKLMALM